jgi:hypothetical protein
MKIYVSPELKNVCFYVTGRYHIGQTATAT